MLVSCPRHGIQATNSVLFPILINNLSPSSIHLHSSHFSDQQHLVSSPNQLHLIFVYTTLLFSTYSPDQQCLVFISTSSYPASLQKATSNFPSLPAMVWLIISTPTTSFQEQIFKNCLHQTYYIKLSRTPLKIIL